MALRLDTGEVRLLGEALAILSAPFEAGDVDRWRRRVNRVVRDLVQGDEAAFVLPGCGSQPVVSAHLCEGTLHRYDQHYRDVDEALHRTSRRGTGAYSLRELFATDLGALLRSACYNDFYLRHGIGDAVGIVLEPGPAPFPTLAVHYGGVKEPGRRDRSARILELLLPAFDAATELWRRFHHQRERLGAVIDAMEDAVAVVEVEGRTVHHNVALRRLMAGQSKRSRARLEDGIVGVARAVRPPDPARSGVEPDPPSRRLRAGEGAYELRAALLGKPLGLSREAAMVWVRERGPRPDRLRVRYGLTDREIEVARLLERRRTNREIAESLSISHHTARHHTQRVLDKLGVGSRRDVGKTLRGEGSRRDTRSAGDAATRGTAPPAGV